MIGAIDVDDRYMEELKKQSIHPEIIKEMAKDIRIVYTPLHGTGNLPVRRVLKELGFEQVYVVPEQELPDGNFPTVSYPNPEDPKAFELALKLAKEKDADIVLATDPDADRLGVYCKDTVKRRLRFLYRKYVRYADRRVHLKRAYCKWYHAGKTGVGRDNRNYRHGKGDRKSIWCSFDRSADRIQILSENRSSGLKSRTHITMYLA